MEGRPPFDPDDDLDFDFESSRRRRYEREQGTGDIEWTDMGEEELPGDDPSSDEVRYDESRFEEPAEDTGERPARRRREEPSSGGLKLPGFGGGRRDRGRRRERSGDTGTRDAAAREREARERAERRARTGERPALTGASTTDTGEQRRLRDDPYTPAEVPVPGDRRSHHRDLPAKVRRRQAIAIAVVALVVLGGGYALASGLFGGDDDPEPTPTKQLIGQSMIGRLGKGDVDPDVLKRVRKGQIGGFIVESRSEAQATAAIEAVNQAAEDGDVPAPLIMIDQEGGDVKRLPGPPTVSPQELGESGDTGAAEDQGSETGAFLKDLGIDLNLAPVMDVELPQTAESISSRTFGEDPAAVSDLGTAFISGLQSEGVGATAKHFPGLGTATVNTDDASVDIAASQEDLDTALGPFQAAVEADVDLIMMSSAAYPRLGSDKPAVFSSALIRGTLREQYGFEGLVISDDLESPAIASAVGTPGNEAPAAYGAGVELLLYASSDRGLVSGFNAMVKAATAGDITREQLEDSAGRIEDLKSSLGD